MYNEKMYKLGSNRSVIRDLFEYGKQLSAEIGAENVFDFTLGNPNVAPPASVDDSIRTLLTGNTTALHGYTSAQGDAACRKAVADNIKSRFGVAVSPDDVYFTTGAAAALAITLNALFEEGDEYVAIAPFFPEYRVFAEAAGAKLRVVPLVPDMQIDFEALSDVIGPHTKGVIINSPNNPSGTVYDEQTIIKLANLLEQKQRELKKDIFLISDEPYRDIVYDGVVVPYPPKYYANTVICYSYSKALSLAGERIGYIALAPDMTNRRAVYAAVCGAGRALGYVCASSLFQRVISMCINDTADINVYKTNRDILFDHLTKLGFECVYPKGAFYLFVKAPDGDSKNVCEQAKKIGLLIVPADSFDAPGYLRISYCVSTEMLKRSLPTFDKLAAILGLK